MRDLKKGMNYMKNLTKIFCCNVSLLMLLAGCTDDTKEISNKDASKNNSAPALKPTTNLQETKEDTSNSDSSSKLKPNNGTKEKEDNSKDLSTSVSKSEQQSQETQDNNSNDESPSNPKSETSTAKSDSNKSNDTSSGHTTGKKTASNAKENTNKETSNGDYKKQNSKGHNSQSDNFANEIKTNTPKKDQEKAISLVSDYLRNRYPNDVIEDKNHFLEYDGEIRGYIIVRWSTLVTDHTSTNGRYAVDINSSKITNFDKFSQ